MRILITGAAGFIGMHVAKRLLEQGEEVIGVDDLNAYYDVALKLRRLDILLSFPKFKFKKVDIADDSEMSHLFSETTTTHVIHLAAQAGVRYSLNNPRAYSKSNLHGFINVLEGCRAAKIKHLVFASSSSVYGANRKMPFSVHDATNHPVSLYAATKKSNELLAHAYSHLFGLPVTGLRFFTVYGPWGRPDMSPMLFAKAILAGKPIQIFNEGRMQRDFTYIDDIVDGVVAVLGQPAAMDTNFDRMSPDPASSYAPYRIYNIGNGKPVELLKFISVLEQALGRPAIKSLAPMQDGDVEATFADVSDLQLATDFAPRTSIEVGVREFVTWYKNCYSDEGHLSEFSLINHEALRQIGFDYFEMAKLKMPGSEK